MKSSDIFKYSGQNFKQIIADLDPLLGKLEFYQWIKMWVKLLSNFADPLKKIEFFGSRIKILQEKMQNDYRLCSSQSIKCRLSKKQVEDIDYVISKK